MADPTFYGPELATVHHDGFGDIAAEAADRRAGWDTLETLVGRVRAALSPGGLFLFDLSGPGRAGPEGEHTTIGEGDGWFIAATSTETPDGRRLDRSISLFDRDADGRYRRVDEHHTLTLFEPERVVDLCRVDGFTVERRSRYGPTTTDATPPSGWTVFVAVVADP